MKQKVITITNPKEPFMTAAHMMALGRTIDASLISSDICTAESAPIRVYIGDNRPTMNASPVVFQPPKLENVVNTSTGELRGARTQRGMRTAKNPRI